MHYLPARKKPTPIDSCLNLVSFLREEEEEEEEEEEGENPSCNIHPRHLKNLDGNLSVGITSLSLSLSLSLRLFRIRDPSKANRFVGSRIFSARSATQSSLAEIPQKSFLNPNATTLASVNFLNFEE